MLNTNSIHSLSDRNLEEVQGGLLPVILVFGALIAGATAAANLYAEYRLKQQMNGQH